jgi:hypothetical protein
MEFSFSSVRAAKMNFGWCTFLQSLLSLSLLQVQPSSPVQAEKPLPELQNFLAGVRSHLRSDRLLLSQYTYTEKDIVQALDKKGNIQSSHEIVHEVYPSLEEGLTYRRLMSKDGKPTSQKDLDKQDRAYDKKARDHRKDLEREGTNERARRLAKEAEEKRKEDESIDEAFQLYLIRMAGREILDGRPAVALTFDPRPGYKPRTKDGKTLIKFGGKAWFYEQDYELIRLEVRLLENYSLGGGLLLRLNKGATAVLRRSKINDEIWLPMEVRFNGSGRLLLLKGLNLNFIGQYSDFKKFTVETSIQFKVGKAP